MSAFYHSLSLLEHDSGNLDMALCWLVEGRGDNLCIHGAGHVGNLLRTLVDEQHHEVSLRMVGCDGVGNILHEDGLTGLRLSHDERTLTLTDWREEVYDAGAEIGGAAVATEIELLIREEWGEVLERNTVTNL